MLPLPNTLYRELSVRAGITPNQSHALANAACVLGSGGVPSSEVRRAIETLRAAFENGSIGGLIPSPGIFSGFVSELSAG